MKNFHAVLLAAGQGTRFCSTKSKLLHALCGKPLVAYSTKLLEISEIPFSVVVGHQSKEVKEAITRVCRVTPSFAYQHEQRGTADAVVQSMHAWHNADHVIIMNADMPLVSEHLLRSLQEKHCTTQAVISFVTAYADNPYGYGRVFHENDTYKIIEEKECNDQQRAIKIINAGIYMIQKDFLLSELSSLEQSSITGERYITDLIKKASDQKCKITTIETDFDSVRGVNTLQDLSYVEQVKRNHIIHSLMRKGVRFLMPSTVHIDADISIGVDTVIGAGVQLFGTTSIGKECQIGAYSILENVTLKDNVRIKPHSVIAKSELHSGTSVGPFARLRDGVILEQNVTIGNFVEVKKSVLGHTTKVKHLSYIGNATVGNSVNIGAGAITCNHNGVSKNETHIKDNAFVGSNTTLVAPVCIGKDSFIAAGSVITKSVPDGDLALAREHQVNKKGYAQRIRKKNNNEKNHVLPHS